MDLLSSIRKTGSRGGVNFSWDEVANSNHRENYLGHSLKAPVGRWQKGRDLGWYASAEATNAGSGETDEERRQRERKEEIQKIKEAEEEAIARALGLPVAPKNTSGANAIEVGGQRQIPAQDARAEEPVNDKPKRESRRHGESDRRERRRHRDRSRSRSAHGGRRDRRRSRDGERTRHRHHERHGRDEQRQGRDRSRSRSREERSRRRRERSRERYRSRSRERTHRRRDD